MGWTIGEARKEDTYRESGDTANDDDHMTNKCASAATINNISRVNSVIKSNLVLKMAK
jgi:hypothetical protein